VSGSCWFRGLVVGSAVAAMALQAGGAPRARKARPVRKSQADWHLQQLDEALDLTGAQKVAVRRAVAAFYQQMDRWSMGGAQRIKAKTRALAVARKTGNNKRAKQLRAEIAELHRRRKGFTTTMHEQILAALDEDRKATYRRISGVPGPKTAPASAAPDAVQEALLQLGLIDAQKAQATARLAEAGKDKGKSPADTIEDIKTNVFTPQQALAFAKLLPQARRRRESIAQLQLPDGQARRAEKILAEAAAAADKAHPPASIAIFTAAYERIDKEVLTATQRRKRKEFLEKKAPTPTTEPAEPVSEK